MVKAKSKKERKKLKTWIVIVLFIAGLFLALLGFSPTTLFLEVFVLAIGIFLVCQKSSTPKIFGTILIVIAVITFLVLSAFWITKKGLEGISQEIEHPEIINGTINQAVDIENLSLIISSVKESNKIIADCHYSGWREATDCNVCQPKPDYKFVILSLTITNNGIKQGSLDYVNKELKVDKGYVYEEADLYGCDYREVNEIERNKYEFDGINFYSSILPSEYITGQLAFEIPSDTEATNFILTKLLEPTIDIELIRDS